MKKLIIFISSFIFFLCFSTDTNAAVLDYSLSIDGTSMTTQNYKILPANAYTDLIITAQNSTPYGQFRITACFDDKITQYNVTNPSYFSNPLVVQTNIPCTYYNSTYEGGKIVNFYFDYDISSSGGGGFTTTFYFLSFGGSFQILSVSSSDVPYDVTTDLNDSTIIDQNQTIIDNSNQTNDKLDDLNDNITNDNVSGVEESFSNFDDFLDDNSTITQLITLPVTLYSSILNGISNSCSPFNLGTLYGQSLTLPCVNIGNYLGPTLWGMIDLIISGFAIFSISKKLIKVFNNFSSMKDGDVIDD